MSGQFMITDAGDGYLVQGDSNGGGMANIAIQIDTPEMLAAADFVHA